MIKAEKTCYEETSLESQGATEDTREDIFSEA